MSPLSVLGESAVIFQFVMKFLQADSKAQGETPCPEVIKLFSCSTQLTMKFIQLINVMMPTLVGHFNINEQGK